MDYIDFQLLKLLHDNSRISIVELSKRLPLSRPSIKERIEKLIEQGIIKQYTIQLDHEKLGKQISFFSEISEITIPAEKAVEKLRSYKSVSDIYIVSGSINYLVKATVTDIAEMKLLVTEWMQFSKVQSRIIMETVDENRFLT